MPHQVKKVNLTKILKLELYNSCLLLFIKELTSYFCIMLKSSLLLLFTLTLTVGFGQIGSAPGATDNDSALGFYLEKELWGIQSKRSKPVTPPLYDTLINTSGPYVLAKKWVTSKQQKLWGTLDDEGKQVVQFKYLSLEEHEQTYICSEQNQNYVKYGLIDATGKILANTDFDRISYVGPNRFAAITGKKTRLFDRNGLVIASFASDSVNSLTPGVLQVWLNGKTGLLNTDGLTISPLIYSDFTVENSEIKAREYPTWSIVKNIDTLAYHYDRLKAWESNYIVGNNVRYWLINDQDSTLSKGYDQIQPCNDQIAIVRTNNKYGAINSNGELIVPTRYNHLIYQNGRFVGSSGSNVQHYSLIDDFGVTKSSFEYEAMELSSEGRFPVKRKNKWGFIDDSGIEIIPAVFDRISSFESGHSKVTFLGENGVIDREGNWLLKPRNEQIIHLFDSSYLGSSYNLNFLKDNNGEYIYFTSNKLIAGNDLILELDSTEKILNRISLDGTFIYRSNKYEPQYGEAEGLAIIKKGDKYGMVDVNGNLFIAYRYDSLLTFSEGYAAMEINNRWGYIDRLERIVIQPQFDWAGSFSDGRAFFGQDGKTGVLDQDGNILIEPIHEEITINSSGLYIVNTNNKYGLLNTNGAAVIHPRYELLELLPSGEMIAKRRNRYSIINNQGVTITSKRFLMIAFDKKSGSLSFKQPAPMAKTVYRFN